MMNENQITQDYLVEPPLNFVNASGSPFVVELYPTSVVLGDVNNDGKLDMVAANAGSNNLSVLLGYGNGGFAPQQTFAVGMSPTSVALGDVNNDGKLDMVAANSDNSLSVLLGHGDGTFVYQQTFAAGTDPSSVALGDVNNDGKLDMVSANFYSNNLSVLLGHGNGTFAMQLTFAAGNFPNSAALGDVNNDGNLDIAAANYGSDNLSVLLGHGDGTFIYQQTFAVKNYPHLVTLGDVNNDGKLDMVSANFYSNNLSVLLGYGNGTFAPQQTFAVDFPIAATLGDVNNDGYLDMVSANIHSNNLSVLLGHGNGTFAPQQTFAVGTGPVSVALGDVNNDGYLDMVSANIHSNNLTVLLNELGSTSSLTEEMDSNVPPMVKERFNSITIMDENSQVNTATESDDKFSATDAFATSESSAHSNKLANLPDMSSNFMLGMVLAKMGANAAANLVSAGKSWWQGEVAVGTELSATEHQQAQASFKRLKARITKLLSREGLDKWYQYGLEDLQNELADAAKSSLSLAQVKEWQAELGELEAEYAPSIANQAASMHIRSNSFFKPVVQSVVMLEQPAALPAMAQRHIAA